MRADRWPGQLIPGEARPVEHGHDAPRPRATDEDAEPPTPDQPWAC